MLEIAVEVLVALLRTAAACAGLMAVCVELMPALVRHVAEYGWGE